VIVQNHKVYSEGWAIEQSNPVHSLPLSGGAGWGSVQEKVSIPFSLRESKKKHPESFEEAIQQAANWGGKDRGST